jgi:hypothetical protein
MARHEYKFARPKRTHDRMAAPVASSDLRKKRRIPKS